MAGKNAIAKTGSEPFDLRFDPLRHVDLAIERNMAVGPECVFTARRACFVKKTLLRHHHKRALGNFSARDIALCELTGRVLRQGLGVLGIEVLEQM